MGILGPVIAAEVGDTVKVLFKNMAARHVRNIKMHSYCVDSNFAVLLAKVYIPG